MRYLVPFGGVNIFNLKPAETLTDSTSVIIIHQILKTLQ